MKRILIVEDEAELAANIKELLVNLDYEVAKIVNNGVDALRLLEFKEVDMILMDIMIEGDIDGIDLAYKIRETFDIPIVFSTAYSDQAILDRINSDVHEGYLLKPFGLDALKAAVYMGFKKHKENQANNLKKATLKIFDKGYVVPVPLEDITFIKADGLYTKVYTTAKTYIMRDILKNVVERITHKSFVRVHKSFMVNTQHVDSFNSKKILIKNQEIPIRRGFYKELKTLMNLP